MRDRQERLRDILEAIERTEKYAAKGKSTFDQDELVQVWILHHLQVIGEAARSLGPELMDDLPEIPWSDIIGMRHVLVHHYFEIDTEIVWSVIERDLPRPSRCFAVSTGRPGYARESSTTTRPLRAALPSTSPATSCIIIASSSSGTCHRRQSSFWSHVKGGRRNRHRGPVAAASRRSRVAKGRRSSSATATYQAS